MSKKVKEIAINNMSLAKESLKENGKVYKDHLVTWTLEILEIELGINFDNRGNQNEKLDDYFYEFIDFIIENKEKIK